MFDVCYCMFSCYLCLKKKKKSFVLCGVLCVFFLVSILFVKKEKEKLFP
jgi:competence protein ComGC